MGCRISRLDPQDLPQNRKSTRQQQGAIVPPVAENNYCISSNKKYSENNDKGVAFVNNTNNNEVNSKSVLLGDIELKEKCLVEEKRTLIESRGKEEYDMHAKNVKNNIIDVDDEHEEENKDRNDGFIIAMASPSFRDYWINYDSMDQSSLEDSNGNDDSTNMKNKVKTEENVNCNKEHKKKEGRRQRRIRNVMNKGKTKGRRRLINFGCYRANNESYSDGSFNNKIIMKTT